MTEEKTEFRLWMDNRGLTYRSMSRITKVSYYTLTELGSGDNWVPHARVADMIRKKFPRCPLLRREPWPRMEAR